ncbi:MAG TPA: carbohydrate ABC transporter permease, partial [Burkholderiales bacterium]
MIEGARWKKWLWFYLPMGAFILALLFPFYWMAVTTLRPDGELYRPWNHPLYAPFWTSNPTFDHIKNLVQETLFDQWLWNTMLIALAATLISLVCGVFAGYALARLRFRYAGLLGTAIFVTY